jgi:hypothetical protein
MTKERNEVRLENKLLVNIAIENFESMGLTSNISKNGLSIATTEVLPVKSEVSILIGIADETFTLKGEVIWSKKSSDPSSSDANIVTGIKITEAPDKYFKYVEELLSES